MGKFKENEILNFQFFYSYALYGNKGFSVLYKPRIESIFFSNMNISSDLLGKMDVNAHLGIFDNYKDGSLYSGNFTGLWNCAGILILLGSLLVLFFGYETFRNRDYLKFLSSLTYYKKVFFYILFSRFVIITLTLLFINVGLLLFSAVNQIDITRIDIYRLGGYFLVCLLVMLFFFIFGIFIGLVSRRHIGVITILIIWIVFFMVLPGSITNFIRNRAIDSTEDYKNEISKIKIIKKFEKFYFENVVKKNRDSIEVRRELMEKYFNQDYKDLEKLEENLEERIRSNINNYHRISIFVPTIFYHLTSGEVSSMGYDNFMDFYTYLQELKRKFVRFYIDRVYYNDPRVMVNFIKGDENIFYAQSRLPENFWSGVLITGAYILVLVGLSLLGFRRFIYKPGIKKVPKEGNPEIHLSKKNYFVPLLLFKGHHGFNEHLYNLLSGRLDAYNKDIKMTVDNIDVCDRPGGWDFLYLCHPDRIPGDIPASAYILFVSRLLGVEKKERNRMAGSLDPGTKRKPLSELDDKQKGQAYLSVLPYFKRKIFLLDDVHLDMSAAFIFQLQDIMMDWAAQDSAVILLTTDFSYKYKLENFKKAHNKDVEIIRDWVLLIRELKSLLDEEEGEPVKQT